MSIQYEKRDYLISISGSIFAGLFIYFILSYLLISNRITIPISVAISILIFGLTKYYSSLSVDATKRPQGSHVLRDGQNDPTDRIDAINNATFSIILYVTIFVILIIISYFANNLDFHLFTSWSDFSGAEIIQLASAIMLCFFIPGYGIVLILTKNYVINPILSVLLAYLFSIIITGLTSYVSALTFDAAISQSVYLFTLVYLSILVCVFVRYRSNFLTMFGKVQSKDYHFSGKESRTIIKLGRYAKSRASELLVFGSLFALVVISTYVVYGGITIGDQWYHQGRALLFMSGSMREAAISGAENSYYPPFQSALLAALTSLSGMPLVNAYASIAFLNAVPMFAFYYFFSTWVPSTAKKASLIACSLFILSAGFGWVYLLDSTLFNNITSPESALKAIGKIADLDIISATNFVIPTAPDFSTALIYIALPAGFVLLALVRTSFRNTYVSIFITTAVSFIGILAHYEFYIFVIIASILPLIFKLEHKSYLYTSLLLSIALVTLLDFLSPANFFASVFILGIPLLMLTGLFVLLTWGMYLITGFLPKTSSKPISMKITGWLDNRDGRLKLVIVTAIIFVAAYLYLLCFVVLDELPPSIIREHTTQSSVPWYLYPVRLGTAGVLGLAFILSYLLRRYEKQVFIFGTIIIVSLIIGPYYDEGRFSKYAMMGIIGFASLMIYKILTWRYYHSSARNTAVITTIIITSGLSILIFVGYNSLILQTQDFTNTLSRRHFPSVSELHMYETLHKITDTNSDRYNVLSVPDEHNRKLDGVMSKVSSFAGLSYDKLRQSPLALNASTLDALYRQLSYSDAKYILLPKNSIAIENSLTEPTRFVIQNFKHVYEDDNYIVIEVPNLEPPVTSSAAKVGLAYDNSDGLSLPAESDNKLLAFNNTNFNLKPNDASVVIRNDTQSEMASLFFAKSHNGTTFWSNTISPESGINSFEANFEIISGDENKSNNYVGMKWRQADNEYFSKLSSKGFELYQKSQNQEYKIIQNNSEVEKKERISYKVTVENLDNLINVYINDELKGQIPKNITEDNPGQISRIGLNSYHNYVEFKPVKIWSSPQHTNQNNSKTKYFDYNYPLSLLALSNASYDVFREDDLSIFSKDVVIVPDNLNSDEYTKNQYLDYVSRGGTLIAINANENLNGTFSQLFTIHANESIARPFTSIVSNSNHSLYSGVSGTAKMIEAIPSPDIQVTSSYTNNNQMVAPFAIKKSISNGQIVLVNAGPYFNALLNTPREYFNSLSNISKMLPIGDAKTVHSQNHMFPIPAIIGNMETMGQVTLNSSSLLLNHKDSNLYELNASRITMYRESDNSPVTLNNVILKDLKLIGDYRVLINVTGILKLPGTSSHNDYMSMLIPNDFNMRVILYPGTDTSAEIFTQNNTRGNPIKIDNATTIEFHNVKSGYSNFVPILLKQPEIIVHGNTSIRNANFEGYLTSSGALDDGNKLDFQGDIKTKIGFVDHFNEHYRNSIKTKYITYLDTVNIDDGIETKEELLKLPGDVPSLAIKRGHDIPLMKILTSPANVIAFASLILATITAIWISKRFKSRIISNN